MEFCLLEADFHLQQHVISDLPPEFHAPFLLNQSLRNILHLLWMYCNSNINDAEIINLLPPLFDESSELSEYKRGNKGSIVVMVSTNAKYMNPSLKIKILLGLKHQANDLVTFGGIRRRSKDSNTAGSDHHFKVIFERCH